jgi:hypothetical protein
MKGVFKILALLMAIVVVGILSYILLTFSAIVDGFISIISRYRMKRIFKVAALLVVLVIVGIVFALVITN